MRQAFLFLGALFMAAPALAQTVEYAECKTIAEYFPQADVNYQPGVDVNGKAVVPADLNAAPMELPDIMTIPLSIDLAKRLPDAPAGAQMEASLGFLEVHKDGRVTYEGKDWTPQVYAICRGETLPPLGAEDGQTGGETVQSGPSANNKDRYN